MKRLVVVSQNEYLGKRVRVVRIGEEHVRLLHQAPFAFIYGLQRTYLGYPEKRFPIRSVYDVDDDTPDQEICHRQYKSVTDNYSFFTTPYPEDLNANINRYDAFELYKKEGDLIFNEAKFLARDQDLECLKGALYNLKNLSSVHIMPLPQDTNSSRSWGALSTAVLHPESYQDGYCGYPHEDRRLGVFLQVAALVNVLKIKELVVGEMLAAAKCCEKLVFMRLTTCTSLPLGHRWLTSPILTSQLEDLAMELANLDFRTLTWT
ncbi:hypothetical protein DL98DRAFT_91179 [Cadophora sp. DSE1049]|nr:hypothetical protein DL98DRAFT_91179 [Cadophora sp. DSE1049]